MGAGEHRAREGRRNETKEGEENGDRRRGGRWKRKGRMLGVGEGGGERGRRGVRVGVENERRRRKRK